MLVQNTSATHCATFTTISWYSLKTVMIHRFTSFIKWQANEYHLVHVNYTSYRIHELQEIMLRSVNHLPRFIARSNVIIRNIDFFSSTNKSDFYFSAFLPAIPFANSASEAEKWSVFSRKFQSRSGKSAMWYRHECKEFLIQISHFRSIILSNLRYLWIMNYFNIPYILFTELSRDRSLLRCCGCGRGWCRIESRLWFR